MPHPMIKIWIIRLCDIVHLCVPEAATIVDICFFYRDTERAIIRFEKLRSCLQYPICSLPRATLEWNEKIFNFYSLRDKVDQCEMIPSVKRRHTHTQFHSPAHTLFAQFLTFTRKHPLTHAFDLSMCRQCTHITFTHEQIFRTFFFSFNLIQIHPIRKLISQKRCLKTCRITRHIACVNGSYLFAFFSHRLEKQNRETCSV